MDFIDKILMGFVLASWVMFFFARKNLAFGLAVGVTIFSFIYIVAGL